LQPTTGDGFALYCPRVILTDLQASGPLFPKLKIV
jgi:hypothetical protein